MRMLRFGPILFLIITLSAVGQITNTIYVPAMSLIAHDLGVQAHLVQLVMTAYLLSYGASQFLYGPLSDRYGRRPITLFGLALFCYGSIMATMAHSFMALVTASFIQGTGIGVAGVMSRTIMRDIYRGRRLHLASSHISVALIFAPLIAPLLGGVISDLLGWRAIFAAVSLFGIAVLILEYKAMPETNRFIGRSNTKLWGLFKSFVPVLTNKVFLANMICLLATFGGVSVFEATGGVLFAKLFHLGPLMVSLLFIVPLPPYMLGCYLAGSLNKRISTQTIMVTGIGLLLLGGLTMLVFAALNILNLIVILIPASIYMLGSGFVYPTATSKALEPFPMLAGTAGAALGAGQNIGAGLSTMVSAALPVTSQMPLACILTALAALVATTYFTLSSPKDGALQWRLKVRRAR